VILGHSLARLERMRSNLPPPYGQNNTLRTAIVMAIAPSKIEFALDVIVWPIQSLAECHFCYLKDSTVYVHESFCLGAQRHPLTYVGRRVLGRSSDQIWYLISVTEETV
jgi:hypothetical protein